MTEEMKANLKDVALKHAETLAKDTVDFTFDLIAVAVQTSENKIDDMFLPLLNSLKPKVKELCDKIYKEE